MKWLRSILGEYLHKDMSKDVAFLDGAGAQLSGYGSAADRS